LEWTEHLVRTDYESVVMKKFESKLTRRRMERPRLMLERIYGRQKFKDGKRRQCRGKLAPVIKEAKALSGPYRQVNE